MSKSDANQTVSAYLLLALFLWLAWQLAVRPILSTWQEHRSLTQELGSTLASLQSARSSKADLSAQTISRLRLAAESGGFGITSNSSEAGHVLYAALESAIEHASAKLIQSRPSSTVVSAWFRRSTLQASFQVNPKKLANFLAIIANSKPNIDLELLSLRRPLSSSSYSSSPTIRATSGSSDPLMLDATITLSSWFATDKSKQLAGPVSVPKTTAVDVADRRLAPDLLGGLFDEAYRDRLRNPGPQHYRLSAMTESSGVKVAVLIDKHSGKTKRVSKGESLEGWEITELSANTIKFIKADRQMSLTL